MAQYVVEVVEYDVSVIMILMHFSLRLGDITMRVDMHTQQMSTHLNHLLPVDECVSIDLHWRRCNI